MSDLAQILLALERELADGDGATYRRLLVDDAVVVVPGMALSKAETVEAMDASPGWEEIELADERVVPLDDGAALLTYRFSGRRGEEFEYNALMGSVYVHRDGAWRMAFHQQTPLTT
jgi:hypothetical protein